MSKVRRVRAASSQIKFELPLLYLLTAYSCVLDRRWERRSPGCAGAGEHSCDLVTSTHFPAECMFAMRPRVCPRELSQPLDGKKRTLCPFLAKSLAFGVKGLFFSGQQATHRDVFFSSIKTV